MLQILSTPKRPLLISGATLLTMGIAVGIKGASVLDRAEAELGHAIGRVELDIALVTSLLGLAIAASSFFYHFRPVRWTYANLVIPAALIVTSTVGTLALVETVLYLKYADVQVGGGNSPSARTFYPKYFKTNSQGFRDIERDVDKDPGTFRILALGDSFTFGSGIKHKESIYTAVLERKLNESAVAGATFEVINSGLKGLNTAEQLEYLRSDGLRLDPDLVLVGHVFNDAETPRIRNDLSEATRSSTLLPPRYHRVLNYYSFTYYLARENILGLVARRANRDGNRSGYRAYLDTLYSEPNLRDYEQVMIDMTRTAEDRGIPLLWFSFPEIRAIRRDPYPFSDVRDTLLDIAARNQLKFVELHAAIAASDAPELTVSAWDGHPNEIVHQIAADEIFDRLVADRLIPLRDAPHGSIMMD